MERSFVYEIIEQECKRQDEKWGKQTHSSLKWNAIFGEEHGEVCCAMIEDRKDDMTAELIQCAAVLVQWLACEAERERIE